MKQSQTKTLLVSSCCHKHLKFFSPSFITFSTRIFTPVGKSLHEQRSHRSYLFPPLVTALKSRDLRDLDRGHKDTPGDTFWLAGIYFLVHAIFVASKLWIWQHFRKTQSNLVSFCISNNVFSWEPAL